MGNLNMSHNYYTLLGISPSATTAEVLAAYDRRRVEVDSADQPVLVELDTAVDVLTDPAKRRAYDGGEDLRPLREPSGVSGRELLYGVVGVVLGLLVLSGAWLLTGSRSSSRPTLTEVAAYDAPDFQLKDLNGQPVKLSDYRGKVVLLNFWGTWCEPCKQETPALQSAYSKLQDTGLVVVGVNLLNSERAFNRNIDHVRQFAEQYGVSYPIVLDDSGTATQAYSIAPIPTSYFIDPQGQVRYIRVGELTMRDVEQTFRRLQSESR